LSLILDQTWRFIDATIAGSFSRVINEGWKMAGGCPVLRPLAHARASFSVDGTIFLINHETKAPRNIPSVNYLSSLYIA
jgi:hypothetical protein